jgi:ketosteroid isomerase-like protein
MRSGYHFSVFLLYSALVVFNLGESSGAAERRERDGNLMGHRFFTLNTVVRVNQIEVTRDRNVGQDETREHSLAAVKAFREAIVAGWPEARITWAFSWRALHSEADNYRAIREYVKWCHKTYGDDVTFIPGAYFANAYNTREQVNRDLHDGLARVAEFMGNRFRPQSVLAGFLSSANLQYLADKEAIHVCQGNIWSQFAIDNQDGDGSICYPYYPSAEHFCKPAQSASDFIDCVNLDGWTMDFLAARRHGFKSGFNSRMGVGPIETIGKYGPKVGVQQMLATTAVHFDRGFELNGFAWVTCCWEICLVEQIGHMEALTHWLSEMHKRWPDARCITQGEFGLLWREQFKSNDQINYRFSQKGTGIGGSDGDKEISWYMNKQFRLATLRNIQENDPGQIIDFTRYDLPAKEPQEMTRQWSLMGQINQKETRPQDKPVALAELPEQDRRLILQRYPELQQSQGSIDKPDSMLMVFNTAVRNWQQAYNSGDAQNLVPLYTEDAEYISSHVNGLVAKSRERLIANFQNGMSAGGHLDSIEILSMSVSCDLATLVCKYEATNSGQKAIGRNLLVLVRSNGRWLIKTHMTVV